MVKSKVYVLKTKEKEEAIKKHKKMKDALMN